MNRHTTCFQKEYPIDRFLCRPLIGIPFFFAVMSLVFFLTFSSPGGMVSACLEQVFSALSSLLKTFFLRIGIGEYLCRFLTDGVWMGVASVLSFMPQTAILFFLLAAMEDSGYLARAVFVMNAFMRKFGVSGKSIIPMLIGFGCTVPAIMATATLEESEKEKTVSSLPFIPCNARLPVIVLTANTFFPAHPTLFAIALYALCLLVSVISLILSRRNTGEARMPSISELPKYHIPQPAKLFREVKDKLRDFLIRAGTVVFLSCVIVDLLAMLTPQFSPAIDPKDSILAHIGDIIAPLFSAFGFAEGRLIAALASGFFVKESIVSTIGILIPEGLSSVLTQAEALSFCVFSLLYLPCAATLSAVRDEYGIGKALFLMLRTFVFACMVTYLTYTLAHVLSK